MDGRRLNVPMQRFSIFSLLRNAFRYQADWQRMWRSPEPKRRYDVVIIGGGGHETSCCAG